MALMHGLQIDDTDRSAQLVYGNDRYVHDILDACQAVVLVEGIRDLDTHGTRWYVAHVLLAEVHFAGECR